MLLNINYFEIPISVGTILKQSQIIKKTVSYSKLLISEGKIMTLQLSQVRRMKKKTVVICENNRFYQ